MVRILLGGFLIAHGLVHPWMWAFPKAGATPPQGDSWLLDGVFRMGSSGVTATAGVAWLATVALIVAGLMVWLGADVWKIVAIVGAIASGLAILLVFKPGLSLGLLINVGIIWAALGPHWPITRLVATP